MSTEKSNIYYSTEYILNYLGVPHDWNSNQRLNFSISKLTGVTGVSYYINKRNYCYTSLYYLILGGNKDGFYDYKWKDI
jgi:hypothetical protein